MSSFSANFKDKINVHVVLNFVVSLLFQGKASGNKAALWLRAKMQADFGRIGRTVQSHAKKVLFLGCVLLLTLSLLGLKNAKMESRVEKLWVEGELTAPGVWQPIYHPFFPFLLLLASQ